MTVVIYAFGDVPKASIEAASKGLVSAYRVKVEHGEKLSVPNTAWDAERRQYLAEGLQAEVRRALSRSRKKARALGIATADLYAPGLNFVFGQADLGGEVAVISAARLDPAFWGQKPGAMLLAQRIGKEAVHELGHVFGLRHCPDRRCVMHFSNSLADTDYKRAGLCSKCREKLAPSGEPQ